MNFCDFMTLYILYNEECSFIVDGISSLNEGSLFLRS